MLAPSYSDTQITIVPRSHYQSPIPFGTAKGRLLTSWFLCLWCIIHLIVTTSVSIVITVVVQHRQFGSGFVILMRVARTVYASVNLFGACTGLLLRTAAVIRTLACPLVVYLPPVRRLVARTLSNLGVCLWNLLHPWSLAHSLIPLPSWQS
jgi:hypothetical protein